MKIFNILLLLFVFTNGFFSQTLFESDSSSSGVTTNVQTVTVSTDSKSSVDTKEVSQVKKTNLNKNKAPKRYVSTNLSH